MRKSLVLLLISFAIVIQGNAQKTVKEWAEMDHKKFHKKMQYGSGIGHIKRLVKSPEELPDIKKIGLISFAMIQPTYSEKSTYSVITPYLTEKGSQFFVDILYDEAYPALKSKLAEQNITLLTPSEYNDSEEKKRKYKDVVFEVSGMFKFVEKMTKRISGNSMDVKGTPEGLKYIAVANADAKVWRAVGKFAGELDLDAVLIVETTLGYDGKSLYLQKITSSIIGPNTVPYRESDKNYYAPFGPLKGYLEGINYGFADTYPPKGVILLAKLKKGSVKESYFEGSGEVYARVVEEILNRMNEDIAKVKK
jgi:hypothetical protein